MANLDILSTRLTIIDTKRIWGRKKYLWIISCIMKADWNVFYLICLAFFFLFLLLPTCNKYWCTFSVINSMPYLYNNICWGTVYFLPLYVSRKYKYKLRFTHNTESTVYPKWVDSIYNELLCISDLELLWEIMTEIQPAVNLPDLMSTKSSFIIGFYSCFC